MLTQAAVSEVRSRQNGIMLPYGFGGNLRHEPNGTPFAEHRRMANLEAIEATL